MHCAICGSTSKRLFQKHGYWVRRCAVCGHRFCEISIAESHVNTVYGDDYFTGGKAGYVDYLAESHLLLEHGRRYGRLMHSFGPPGRVLDVGAAAGFILRGLQDTGWSGSGIEPNDLMANHARQVLGLNVQTGSLEHFRTEDRYDLITFIQVLPHLYDLHEALNTASQLTTADGYWLIETWDRESLTAKIMGRHWHEYSPPSVLHWFTVEGVIELGRQFGFQPIARGRPKKVIESGHAKSLLQYKLPRFLQWLPELIPEGKTCPYPAEDLFWVLLKMKGHS